MGLLALTNQLKPLDVELSQLYLDPNNPRFVESEWEYVPDDHISDEDVQERTRRNMVNHFSVEKLKINMEVNGYLPIDRVIVREFKDGKYVVLEGNRRICSAKMISDVASDGSKIAPEVIASLSSIPVLLYTGGDTNAAWIFQGLRHISGIEDWSAFNKAKLLVEQMEEDGLTLTDVGRRFGLSPHGAGQWVRGFYAFKQAREESDFIAEVDDRSYPYFQELFSRSSSALREWMSWNDATRKFENLINFNEFVSWLYPRKEDEDGSVGDPKGDWDRRYFSRRDDLRDLSFLIREVPELFQQFRHSGQLEQAYSQALTRKFEKEAREKADPIQEAFAAIKACARALEGLPFRVLKDAVLKAEFDELLKDLQEKIGYLKD